MALESFETRRFQAKTAALVDSANSIIAEYQARGFTLTLRQLYYQFVSRALIPNTQQDYKRLGDVVKNGRRAGLIDWEAIEDRTRNMRGSPSWASPAGIVADAAGQYREDLWRGQDFRPEVWIEKDALLGVIEQVCDELRLPYFACRGNNSESEQYKAGKRFEAHLANGLTPILLHLGDHDPNGLDMTRDNRDRLAMFARRGVEVRRLALNMDQVDRWLPPPNPAKETDTRFAAYAKQFGSECWELDALDPTVIADLIRDEVEGMIDADAWNAAKAEETKNSWRRRDERATPVARARRRPPRAAAQADGSAAEGTCLPHGRGRPAPPLCQSGLVVVSLSERRASRRQDGREAEGGGRSPRVARHHFV